MSAFGDLAKLGQLARNLRKLGSVPSQASAEAASSIAALIDAQFDAGTDPYGRPWAPVKASTLRARTKKHSPPPLTDTRVLRESIEVRPAAGAGVQITIGAEYGAYAQARRPILPTGVMPATWTRAIKDACEHAVERQASFIGLEGQVR